MQFLVMVKATKASEAGEMPTADELAKMGTFNEALVRDGIFLGAGGLRPTSQGTRISFADGKPSFTDGPFTETKEIVSGFWLLQGRSKQEIVERISRAPFARGEQVEIRQLFEPQDFGGAA
jgi:hypothetical protein